MAEPGHGVAVLPEASSEELFSGATEQVLSSSLMRIASARDSDFVEACLSDIVSCFRLNAADISRPRSTDSEKWQVIARGGEHVPNVRKNQYFDGSGTLRGKAFLSGSSLLVEDARLDIAYFRLPGGDAYCHQLLIPLRAENRAHAVLSLECDSIAPLRQCLKSSRQLKIAVEALLMDSLRRESHDVNSVGSNLQLAFDLHDTVVQSLAAARMNLETHLMMNQPGGESQIALERACRLVKEGLAELRSTINRLDPEQGRRAPISMQSVAILGAERITTEPLPVVMKDVVLRMTCGSLRLDFNFDHYASIPKPVELAVLRVVQEATSNVLKHAEASNLIVHCAVTSNGLHLLVRDDGRGVAPGKVHGTEGFGLSSMRERMHAFGGSLSARSAPMEGFSIEAKIPPSALWGGAALCKGQT